MEDLKCKKVSTLIHKLSKATRFFVQESIKTDDKKKFFKHHTLKIINAKNYLHLNVWGVLFGREASSDDDDDDAASDTEAELESGMDAWGWLGACNKVADWLLASGTMTSLWLLLSNDMWRFEFEAKLQWHAGWGVDAAWLMFISGAQWHDSSGDKDAGEVKWGEVGDAAASAGMMELVMMMGDVPSLSAGLSDHKHKHNAW